MKIDKIIKLNNGKYKLLLENKDVLYTYDNVILNSNILYTKELDENILDIINKENDYYSLYNKAIKYISKRLRSEYEVSMYLDKNNIKKEDKIKIINGLKENGYINDINFTKSYIYYRFNLSSDGPNKIKEYLLNQMIDESIIDENIRNIKEEDILKKLEKIISKKVKLDHKHSINVIKNKLRFELKMLGYDIYMIDEILKDIKGNNNIEKEYNIIYNKLSMKYEGEILLKKIKEKLYQKGYSYDEITSLDK